MGGQPAVGVEGERGKRPNLIAVNFYSLGDLMVVVDEMNGVISSAEAVNLTSPSE